MIVAANGRYSYWAFPHMYTKANERYSTGMLQHLYITAADGRYHYRTLQHMDKSAIATLPQQSFTAYRYYSQLFVS